MSDMETGGMVAGAVALVVAVIRAVRARVTVAQVAEFVVASATALMTWWPAWADRRKGTDTMSPKIKAEFDVAKELSELGEAVCGVIEDLLAGKDLSEIATGNLAALKVALEGVTEIGDEMRLHPGACIATAGAIAGRLVDIYRAAKARKAAAVTAAAPKVAANS